MNSAAAQLSAVERFVASLALDYEKWREGVGYDLEALKDLNAEDRARILALLQQRLESAGAGWREVDAVAALPDDEARITLATLATHENTEVRLRSLRHLGGPGKNAAAEKEIIRLLRDPRTDVRMKVGWVMTMAQENPTPAMVQALLFCAVDGASDLRVHAAALALYFAGKAEEPFDWDFRPLFLEFGDNDRAVRLTALGKLKALMHADASQP